MGKYIIIATFAVALSITLLANQGMRTDLDTSQSQAERQKKVLARQIASSAFKMGVSELKRDFENWRVNREGVAYEGGTFDLSATGPSGGPVTLTAVGHFGETTYEITATATLEETTRSLFNAITAGEDIDFEVSGGACPGGACVSGIDGAGNGDRHGITLGEADDGEDDEDGDEEDDDDDEDEGDENASEVCNEFGGNVEGVGDGCDVVNREEEWNDVVEDQMEKLKSKIESLPDGEKTVCEAEDDDDEDEGGGPPGGGPPGGGPPLALHAGGPAGGPRAGGHSWNRAPVRTASSRRPPGNNCNLTPPNSGDGVLYVKGDLTISGNASWDGLVYVAEGGSVTINGGGNATNINGSLVMEEDTDFQLNGGGLGNNVKYNSSELLDLVDNLPYVSTELVEISDRTGGFTGTN